MVINPVEAVKPATSMVPATNAPALGGDFKVVLEKVAGEQSGSVPKLLGLDLHKDIVKLQEAAVSGKTLSTNELLYYQIKANEFNLRVELTSKVAESAISTTRRLQQAQ